MSYEFELRKEAYRLCRKEGAGIKAALWSTLGDTEHRMVHWLQLISIANSRPSGDYAALERKFNELQREVRRRSRSPLRRGRNRKPEALPASSQPLALADAPAPRDRRGRARAKNNAQKPRNCLQPQSSGAAHRGSSGSKDVTALMRARNDIKKKFCANDDTICFQYQKKVCTKGETCERRHICIGCRKTSPTSSACASTASSNACPPVQLILLSNRWRQLLQARLLVT